VGTNKQVVGTIVRLNAPLTFEKLVDTIRERGTFAVRSRGNIGLPKSYWMLLVGLQRGPEKHRHEHVRVGDILYCPRQDAIFIVYDEPKIDLPVYYLGEVTEGLEHLKEMRNGVMVNIKLREQKI